MAADDVELELELALEPAADVAAALEPAVDDEVDLGELLELQPATNMPPAATIATAKRVRERVDTGSS